MSVFRHDTFETAEIYRVKRCTQVVVGDGEEHLFDRTTVPATTNSNTVEVEATVEIEPKVLHASNRAEDIALVRA